MKKLTVGSCFSGIGGLELGIFVEWLMGYETGWTVLNASEIPSSRKSHKKLEK